MSRNPIAPSQPIWVMSRPWEVQPMGWGWIPAWSRGRRLINARVETLEERVSFQPYTRQRGLVLADAFYEWRQPGLPYRVRLASGKPLLFAAIWMTSGGGEAVAVILTEAATGAMVDIHERQPLAIPSDWAEAWLGAEPGVRVALWRQRFAPEPWQVEPVAADLSARQEP